MKNQFDKDYFYGKKKSNYINYDKLNFRKNFKEIIKFVKKQKLRGNFLDVGCAFGNLVKLMSPYFDKVYGCDISAFAIKKAIRNFPNANFNIANVGNHLNYPNEFFNCITAMDVLEHTSSIDASLSNIIPKLKKDGYLLISLPIDSWIMKKFKFLDKDKTHVSVPKEVEMLRLFKRYKMTLVKKRYFLPFPYFYKIYGIPIEAEFYLRK